ncbi:hypothetical protein C2E23DRAFT_732395 [Lenzites betulinus]|nr:hypothetical protein C2E23DRAFT_732395 [Lenzites betulinus]
MILTTKQFSVFSGLLSILAVASALPLEQRDDFVPPVTFPHAGTVWFVGQRHNVTWDTSNAPKQITNRQGKIVLAKGGLLDNGMPHPLATGFDILLGRTEVTVPNVTPGSDYTIVLFGNSGNDSPEFTISK